MPRLVDLLTRLLDHPFAPIAAAIIGGDDLASLVPLVRELMRLLAACLHRDQLGSRASSRPKP